jgi:hypothetical protein
MKSLIKAWILLLLTVELNAQNYEPILVDSNISFFSNQNNKIRGTKIDSSYQINNVNIFEFNKTWNTEDRSCIKPNGPSWLGYKMAIINNQFLFFNQNNDTIYYHPSSNLGTTWRFYTFEDSSYILAKISSKIVETFLNTSDSMIEYSFTTYDKNNNTITSQLDNQTLKISKNYGSITILEYLTFPVITVKSSLIGTSKNNLGKTYLTLKQTFDFEIGDEFHYEKFSYTTSPDDNKTNSIHKILDKKYSNNRDTVYYQIKRATYFYYANKADKNHLLIDTLNVNYFINEKQYLPEEPILNYASNESTGREIIKNSLNNRRFFNVGSTHKHNSNNGCWYELHIDPGYNITYGEGLGFFSYDTYQFPGNSNENMVYYKKGVETWGVPFDNLSIEKIEKPSISVFPNPIARNEPLVINMMSEASQVEIINMLGEIVLNPKVSKNSNQVDISRLQLGVYFVRCSYFNNHFIKKIVVY